MKKYILDQIEEYYPVDNLDPDNAKIGQILLEKAKIQTGYINWFADWREYPENVLRQYLENCIKFKNEVHDRIRIYFSSI